ncbi:UNVERIFIED_CONTAM: hypothetical protein Slati_2213500 [Sesamum latifolium]|uniref:Reverse transcriptase domain-containing protein n=1 Tax=Sesamum latifolium TaxID=2727402 RepID=A0AAW2WU19_9LAMI
MILGHSLKGCPAKKPRQPPVSVYVQKPVTGPREPMGESEPPAVPRPNALAPRAGSGSMEQEDKGKAIVLYNAFEMIDATIWNVRGLNCRDHQVSVANLVSEHRLHFIGLLETRVSVGNVARGQRGLLPRRNWFVDYVGPGNRIWLAWDDDLIDLNVLETGAQFVHCSAHIHCMHVHVLITVVYGVNEVVGRRVLWDDLDHISHTVRDVPWLVGGDFNTVVDVSEVCGQSGYIHGAAEEFQSCLWNTGLITLPMQGEWFTWHNCSRDARSLWKRLDRILVNDWWLERWPNTYYVSLNARTFDHSPLVLRGDTPGQSISMFRFDNYLTLSAEFIPSVQQIWQHHIVGTTMFAMTRKLRALKPVFRAQRQKQGDLSNNVKLAAGFRRRHNALTNEFITFYQTLLGGSRRDCLIDLRYLRPWARHILSEEETHSLLLPVTADEIKQAVFDIDKTKAPGPDGYSSGFFKAAWPIVGREVNNTTVVAEFRPISCCNVLYKVITKILVQRMRGILDKLISPSQNAFAPGRSIGDNILLAQELFYGYNQQHLPPRCALKVDHRKAYDTVEWDFLRAVLILFGFPEKFIM